MLDFLILGSLALRFGISMLLMCAIFGIFVSGSEGFGCTLIGNSMARIIGFLCNLLILIYAFLNHCKIIVKLLKMRTLSLNPTTKPESLGNLMKYRTCLTELYAYFKLLRSIDYLNLLVLYCIAYKN
jgi:hypothetical protein